MTVRLLILFALVCAILLSTLAWLLATESGLQFLWHQAAVRAGPELTATRVTGSLAGRLHLESLAYRAEGLDLELEQLEIAWEPRALLGGTLHFSEIRAATLRYVQTGESAPGPVELPALTLPLRVRVDALHIDTASITTSRDAEPLQLRDIGLSARADGSRVTLSRLALAAPGFSLAGSAGLDLQGDYPLHGELQWQWHDGTMAPLIAQTRLDGSLRRLELQQAISPPYGASARLTVSDTLEQPSIDGTLQLRNSDLQAIVAGWPALHADAALNLAGPVGQLRIKGNGSVRDAQDNRVDATLDAEMLPAQLQLRKLQLSLPEQPARLQLQGRIDFAATTGFDLVADWQELAWPLHGDTRLSSSHGALALAGDLNAYEVNGSTRVEGRAYPPVELDLRGHGNLKTFDITTLHAKLLDGVVEGSARLAWEPQTKASLQLTGTGLNPAVQWKDWPGKLSLRLKATMDAGGDAWLLRFEEAHASGNLRGQPLQLAGSGSYRPGMWEIADGTLSSGPNHFKLQGQAGDHFDLAWEIDSPDLATLAPATSGQLSGKGGLKGTPQAPRLTVQLNGRELRYHGDGIRSLRLGADIDAGGEASSRLDLKVAGGRLAGQELDRLDLTGTGTPEAHDLEIAADGEHIEATVKLGGSWREDTWTYTLRQADVTPAGGGTWRLTQAVTGRVNSAGMHLPDTCWNSGDAGLCLQGELQEAARTAEFRLHDLPLATLAGLLPYGMGLQGTLAGEGHYRQAAGVAATGHLRLETSSGQLAFAETAETHDTILAFAPGHATLDVDAEDARLDLNLPLQADAGNFTGHIRLSPHGRDWLHGRLAGEVQARIPDISFAGELLPEVSDLQGRLDGEIKLAGTPASPRLQGHLLLADARALLDTPGLQLEDVRIELAGRPDGGIRLDAQARSGDGLLQATGSANPDAEPTSAKLSIRGDDVRLLNTLDARIDASPQLEVTLSGSRIDVGGEIVVPRATIQPRKLPGSAISPSRDQVIIGEEDQAVASRNYPIHTHVRFTLGKDVEFDGLGLTGKLGGSILAVDEPGRPTQASGELNIRDGKYRAYGQDLEIRRGRLLFAGGPITEPGIDLEAIRRPTSDILTGVKVYGSLQQPELSLFSEPPMTQSAQLSWLVLGRPLEGNTSDSEKSALNRAALLLGMSGGATLGKELGKKIGVDKVSVESEAGDTTTASLLVGKYLTPKLLVSYGIGLFEPVSALHLRYTLSSHWKLVGKTSTLGSSTDLFYEIESGK